MAEIEKIKAWIQIRKLCTMDEHMKFYCKEAESDYNLLCSIEKVLDSTQEEPVSVWHDASKIPDNSEDIVIEHSEYGTTIIPACKMSRVKGAKWARLDDILKL